MFLNALEPYCGPAPVPSNLWQSWNFDPFAIALMAGIFVAWLHFGRKDNAGRMALMGALGLIAIAFLSPLCALTVALFSARVVHHIVLIAVTAPLLAIALPWRSGPLLPLSALTLLSGLMLWIWHAPSAYEWAIHGALPYWMMQLSLLGTAWLFWREVFSPLARQGAALIALVAFVAQMGLLGALLVFAPYAVYAPHFGTTAAFGLSALSDQQLAGLLMWVPAILPYAAAGLWLLLRLLGALPSPLRRGMAQ